MDDVINFGVHLTIDGYNGNPEKLNNGDLLKRALNELPEKIGMHVLSEAMVFEAPPANPKDGGGYSGFVIIAESHISCHTFPKRRFVSIDVYTCKNVMDNDAIIKYFTELFELGDVETNYIKRGTRFPANDLA